MAAAQEVSRIGTFLLERSKYEVVNVGGRFIWKKFSIVLLKGFWYRFYSGWVGALQILCAIVFVFVLLRILFEGCCSRVAVAPWFFFMKRLCHDFIRSQIDPIDGIGANYVVIQNRMKFDYPPTP